MVEFYVKKILDGSITIDDVPKLWREKVKDRIAGISDQEQEKENSSV